MTKYIHWTYRAERIWTVDLTNLTLNWVYTPSFYLNNQFWDWYQAWLTNIIDNIIPEDRYIWVVIPWIPKLTRFIMAEYNENYVDPIELSRSITNTWARFNIDMITDLEIMKQRIRDNTNLVEETDWHFLINPETTWINQEVIPAKYLIIE